MTRTSTPRLAGSIGSLGKVLRVLPAAVLVLTLPGCQGDAALPVHKVIGQPESFGSGFDAIVDPTERVEALADGYAWSEGPVWVGGEIGLLFSDVPGNTIHRWTEAEGASVWLTPSGDTQGSGGGGSNGLTLDALGRLVLAQHGDHQIGRLALTARPARAEIEARNGLKTSPSPEFETLASEYQGRRLNSPNDLVYATDGSLYFTDPPYGLESPAGSELGFMGVYRLDPDGVVTLLDSTLSRPNGIALSPDESVLYVANSDPSFAVWMAYQLDDGGTVSGRVLFADATASVGEANPGLPDGMKVDVEGRLFATGPGGVWILDSAGTHLGTIRTDGPTANVAFGEDGSTLFLTSNQYLARIRTKTRGLGFGQP